MTKGSDDYQVGYGRPPLHSRFSKGRSGNPKGRNRKPRGSSTPLLDILAEPQIVQVAGRRVSMTKGEILFRKMLEKAMQGDFKTSKMLLDFMSKSDRIEPTKTPALDIRGAREELARKLGAVLELSNSKHISGPLDDAGIPR